MLKNGLVGKLLAFVIVFALIAMPVYATATTATGIIQSWFGKFAVVVQIIGALITVFALIELILNWYQGRGELIQQYLKMAIAGAAVALIATGINSIVTWAINSLS